MNWVITQIQIVMIKKKIAELDLSNYSTRSEVKNTIDVDTLDFSEIDDLAGLKSDIGEWNIDKLKTNLTELIKPSNIVDSNVSFLKKSYIMNLLKKSILLIQSKKSWKKIENVDKNMPCTSKFIVA